MSGSVESIVSCTTAVIVSVTHQFVPSCVPKMVCPTTWWNRYCERAWQWKMSCWNNHDDDGFCRATSIATCVYARAFREYQSHVMNKLRKSPTDRYWWNLTKSLSGIASRECFSVPSPSSLATYFATKLSTCATDPEPYLEHPSEVLLRQLRVKKSRVCHILTHLDPAESVGDDNISPRVLKYCPRSLCGPLTALFRRICCSSIFPSAWKISRIAPIYKHGSRTDPANYHPVAVLPTLSGVFERVLLFQLEKHITPFIPSQQFGFMSGSSCADAGISMTGSIVAALISGLKYNWLHWTSKVLLIVSGGRVFSVI